MRIIGFGAHPDDAEIYFFGTLAAAKAGGAEISWVIATDGSKGGDGPAEALRSTRQREATDAAALLGVEPVFLGHVDGELASDAGASDAIEDAILRLEPDLVITHAPNDYHPDHRALSRLVSDAARFHTPVVFSDTLLGVGFAPTHYVDVTAWRDSKVRALRKHASQQPERFVEATEVWSRFRALQCNASAGYAEAFRFEPVYPFADVRSLLPPPPAVAPLAVRWRR